MIDLKNKVAIVTGARRGMGKTHAIALAKAGAKVVVADISKEDCEIVVKEIEKSKGEAISVKCDVTQKEEVDKMIKAAVDKWGRLDILVSNAGVAEFVPFLDMTEENWSRTLDINLKGCFLCNQAAAKVMTKQKSGTIVNIASVAMGQQGIGFPNIAHYCASKGGIVAMTEALAVELAPYNIRVNAVSPGMIETPMIGPMKQDKKSMEGIMARVPMRRVGKPEEVSNLVLFLASDDSSYMTGSAVVIDGGWLAG
ncbi:MAG: SDR family NAD(P)-dependent oxidoreductase [Candidatus Nealsonbacteria bacterium]